MNRRALWLGIGIGVLLCAATLIAAAAPFVPVNDEVVVERLPERLDPTLKELRRMRAALASRPGDLEMATAVARRALDASRSSGDPRFLGQAQAALAPWWSSDDAPPAALLLRATLKQSQHDFDGARADLDRSLERQPANGQALLTRATVATVQGRYEDARHDCQRLARLASPLIAATCLAGPASFDGDAERAYRMLVREIERSRDSDDVRAWALTLAAEIAARQGDARDAEMHFETALALDPGDAYLRGAYADFLLDQQRSRDVLPLLADANRNDALLLRLALAEKALPDRREAFVAHRDELAARFAAARARGDVVHRREEARFRLVIEDDARGALALARANWSVQREPADLRVLADAAHALGDAEALAVVEAWRAAHGTQDATWSIARGARR